MSNLNYDSDVNYELIMESDTCTIGGETFNITLTKHACHLCDFKSDWASSLKNHIKRIHLEPRERKNSGKNKKSDKPMFFCYHCNYKTRNMENLSTHIHVHLNHNSYSCDFCAYQTRTASCWRSHMKKHFGIGMQTCETCGYTTHTANDLRKHVRIHTGEKPFVCDMCGKGFSINSNLIIHMRKHTGDKPFSCNVCSYKTVRKGDLTSHMKSHSNEKPYSCPCGFKTARSGHLKRHMVIHNKDVRPFKCDSCPKTFRRAEEKKRHEECHEKRARIFDCPHCDYVGFNMKLLRKHAFKIHSDNLKPDENYVKCPHCPFLGGNATLLDRHVNRFHSSPVTQNSEGVNCDTNEDRLVPSKDGNFIKNIDDKSNESPPLDKTSLSPCNRLCNNFEEEEPSVCSVKNDSISSIQDQSLQVSKNVPNSPEEGRPAEIYVKEEHNPYFIPENFVIGTVKVEPVSNNDD